MMRTPLALSFFVLAVALPACSLLGSDDAPPDAGVQITAASRTIVIQNRTDERIYYTAFARGVLPTINWAQHVTEDQGPSLAPGESVGLAATDIWRFAEEGPEVVVYWWRVEVREDERVPTEPEAVIVEL